jgi:hypothetical protein
LEVDQKPRIPRKTKAEKPAETNGASQTNGTVKELKSLKRPREDDNVELAGPKKVKMSLPTADDEVIVLDDGAIIIDDD